MSDENEQAVLAAIGQIALKTDFNDPEDVSRILSAVSRSKGFSESACGKAFIEHIKKTYSGASVRSEGGAGDPTIEELINRSDQRTENLFRDLDESLFHVASQETTRSVHSLMWINVGLSVVSVVIMIFVALFVWKLNMG
ncbi:MAG: hypothetical protein J6N76_03880 [Lachnospiraceae bacterium]|nr:hypothetical protein [Lachnospiraceae bacterium]